MNQNSMDQTPLILITKLITKLNTRIPSFSNYHWDFIVHTKDSPVTEICNDFRCNNDLYFDRIFYLYFSDSDNVLFYCPVIYYNEYYTNDHDLWFADRSRNLKRITLADFLLYQQNTSAVIYTLGYSFTYSNLINSKYQHTKELIKAIKEIFVASKIPLFMEVTGIANITDRDKICPEDNDYEDLISKIGEINKRSKSTYTFSKIIGLKEIQNIYSYRTLGKVFF
jgi:hypothetical protein